MKSAAEVLEGVADLLGKRGKWAQGNEIRSGRLCLGMAIDASLDRLETGVRIGGEQAYSALYAVAPFSSISGLIYWNDEKGRKKSEVVALARKAAALARVPA